MIYGAGGVGSGSSGPVAVNGTGQGGRGFGTTAQFYGGSGIVVLAIPTAYYSGIYSGTVAVSTVGSNTILTFTGAGTYTP